MLSTAIIGLSIAMLLFLMATGLTLIFGMLGIINFAHGALYMLGAFISYQTVALTGSFWLALLTAPLLVALLGAAIEIGLLRALYRRDHVEQLLLTFGLILVIEEGVRLIWGPQYRSVSPPAFAAEPMVLLGQTIAGYRVLVVGLGLAVSAALLATIEFTRLGMVLRAAISNPDMTRCLGIRVDRVRTLVFMLGAALAALGGAIAAPLLPVQVGMGFSVIIDCFIVVIIGGLGSILGAVVAALMLGMTYAFGQQFAPEWVDVSVYVLLIAVLLLRPQGLFGRRGRA